MKRTMAMLSVMVTMLLLASGVAQAGPVTNGKADARCLAEAVRTLGPGFNPSGYHFVGGTAGDDFFDRAATAGPDVLCGFGGNDSIATLDEGDIFLGGMGNDQVTNYNYGTFNGGAGDDSVGNNYYIFNGGAGNDTSTSTSCPATSTAARARQDRRTGFFDGGEGDDGVTGTNYGTFYGGAGEDFVTINGAFGVFDQD